MMGQAFKFTDELTSIDCPHCGVVFAVPSTLEGDLRNSHRSFFCPNGHSLSFKGETEAEKLKKQLAAEQTKRATAETEATYQRTRADRAAKNLARIQKRAKHGVCPCCNRTFKQLAAHMKSKHPDFEPKAQP